MEKKFKITAKKGNGAKTRYYYYEILAKSIEEAKNKAKGIYNDKLIVQIKEVSMWI